HFTQSKNLTGPDHKASLNPGELEKMVKEIRKVERYLGSSMKELTESERETRKYVQKYLVAAQGIQNGEFFTEENIVIKRTGREGLSPHYYDRLIGTKAKRDYLKNEMID
ncbi:MAG: N-acetylneuraminate synthase family protein, partial [Deltaproteobacteria bacterium]